MKIISFFDEKVAVTLILIIMRVSLVDHGTTATFKQTNI